MNKIRYKYQSLFLLFMVGNLFSITNNETGWDYTQTTQQTFHILEFNIDGHPAEGDGKIGTEYDGECLNNPSSCDVIGAFMLRDENEFGDLDTNYVFVMLTNEVTLCQDSVDFKIVVQGSKKLYSVLFYLKFCVYVLFLFVVNRV